MQHLVDAVNKALENDNWYAALYLSLTLPDICGKIEFPDITSSKQRYVQWFDKYLRDKYTREIGANREKHTFLSGEDCYAFRCSLLHEGLDIISHQSCRNMIDSFLFVHKGSHCNNMVINGHNMLQLSVDQFCRDMCRSIEAWLIDVSDNDTIQKKLADTIIIHTSGATRCGVHVK